MKDDYSLALKAGQREYKRRLHQGLSPYLEVLDDILAEEEAGSEVKVGLTQIPVEFIAGTSNSGRTTAFAANFMPILDEDTEFATKWTRLCQAHLQEGIREPVKAYEYKNRYYIVEGNKRVSVLKYFDAVSIPGNVTRIMPKHSRDKKTQIYFEFLGFNKLTNINYIEFTKMGCYERLLTAVGKSIEDVWTDDDRMELRSCYIRFQNSYRNLGGDRLNITTGDAFLTFLEIYGYDTVRNFRQSEYKKPISKIWEELRILEDDQAVELVLAPEEGKKASLLERIFDPERGGKLKAAFLYYRTPDTSAWVHSHEQGRLHVLEEFSGQVETEVYENVSFRENADDVFERAIANGCTLIFATSPDLLAASLKAAVNHPLVKILNCSLFTAHPSIRTYYGRNYEAKFISGAVAGSLAADGRIGYVEDYPMFGSTASINAFALGARMVNPRAKIYLEWSTVKGKKVYELFRQQGIGYVSLHGMIESDGHVLEGGLYELNTQEGSREKQLLLSATWNWGEFYEQIVRHVLGGGWKEDEDGEKAINYWWGISAGVLKIASSSKLNRETNKLIRILTNVIARGEFNPFQGVLTDQSGQTHGTEDSVMSPERIVSMDWLVENVEGSLPVYETLSEDAREMLVKQSLVQHI